MKIYRHTQIGWAVVLSVLFILGVALGTVAFLPEARPVSLWLAGLGIQILAFFSTLTVTIADGWLRCHFGLGLIWRRICLADIREVRPVRNPWWYGWGIRLTPCGWLWNVSGLDAVELTYANGKRFRLGIDEAEELLAALRAARG